MRIYVGNLPYSTTSEDLEDICARFGGVSSAQVITDRESGRSKGFGFVEMDSGTDGQNAISELNGTELGGRTIVVNEARPRRDRR